MKKAVVYFSVSGKTRKVCESLKNDNVDMFEIKPVKKRTTFNAYIRGVSEVKNKKYPEIVMPDIDTSKYDVIVLAAPIWASEFASEMLSFISKANLKGCNVVALGVSMSGKDYSTFIKANAEMSGAKCVNCYCVKSNAENVIINELA